jgi:hypothetical protein
LELLVAARIVTGRFVFVSLATRQAEFVEEHPPQGIWPNLEAIALQRFNQIGGRTIGSADAFVHGRTGRILRDQRLDRCQLRLATLAFLRPPFFRTRPSASFSDSCSMSCAL